MMSQAGNLDVNSLMQRLRRLATLDTTVFDEVKDDANATIPALIIVAVSTFLTGIGGWLWLKMSDFDYKAGTFFFKSAIIGSVLAIVLWAVWVGVTYVMLSQIFRARADLNQLIRVMGFASAPLALGLLVFVPQLDYGIGLTSLALLFGTTQIAVQSTTDAPAGRVLAANGAGFAVWAIVLELFVAGSYLYNSYAPGIFAFAPR